MTVSQLVVYHSLIAMFKIRQSREPEYLAILLCNDSRNGRIIIPRLNLSLALNSFALRGTSKWNQLPDLIRRETKLGPFKRRLRKWILERLPMFE